MIRAFKYFPALFSADKRNISRDATTAMMLSGPILLIIVFRFAVPFIAGILQTEFSFSLTQFYPALTGFAAVIPPHLFGMLCGMMIIDDADNHIIQYLRVTPLGVSGYLAYRLLVPFVLSFISVFAVVFLVDLTPAHPALLLPSAIVLSASGITFGVILARVSANKVEAIAWSKAGGVLFLAPAAAFFLTPPLKYLAVPFPTFMAAEIFRLSLHSPGRTYGLVAAAGILISTFFFAAAVRWFIQK